MKVGFIGAGNMGSAMMASMKSQAELYVYDIAAAACEKAKLEFGAQITKDIQEVVAISDIVFVAIKPQFLDEILKQIKEAWSQEKILASIVAGKTLAFWQEILGEEAQIARIMPNTPAQQYRSSDAIKGKRDGCGYGSCRLWTRLCIYVH